MNAQCTQYYKTPCSPAWDNAWIKSVNDAERAEKRAICGARTPNGTPCTLPPNHKNGRCQYHGGFTGTGAQPQNRNACVHGLYARGLQQCGPHCPLFQQCPVASPHLEKLPKNNRPTCPFETAQFQTALTDAEDRVQRMPDEDPLLKRLAPQVALLEVMVMRAASALAVQPFVQESNPAGSTSALPEQQPKANPALAAFLRLSSEFRRYLALLDNPDPVKRPFGAALEHTRRQVLDTELTPEAQNELQQREELPPPELCEEEREIKNLENYIASHKEQLVEFRMEQEQQQDNTDPEHELDRLDLEEDIHALEEKIKKYEAWLQLRQERVERLAQVQKKRHK